MTKNHPQFAKAKNHPQFAKWVEPQKFVRYDQANCDVPFADEILPMDNLDKLVAIGIAFAVVVMLSLDIIWLFGGVK